jgi:enamine deaminase RidA (YjgF/YER057c/UK114 family)
MIRKDKVKEVFQHVNETLTENEIRLLVNKLIMDNYFVKSLKDSNNADKKALNN